jgi:hypothetical protein
MEQITNTYEQTDQGSLEGYTPVRRSQNTGGRWGLQEADPAYTMRVAVATEFLADVLTGRAPAWALKEALVPSWPGQSDLAIRNNYPELYTLTEAYSTSDFPFLMGDVLDRMMLANFRALGHDWRSYCGVSRPLRDFRTVRRLALNGAEGQYTEIVEGEEVTYTNTLDEDNYTYEPTLYGKGVKLTFRAIMNDDLNAFDSIPERLGKGGRRTIEQFVTELFFDSSGPDATFFSSGNGNLLSSNPDLAIDSLGTAIGQLLAFTDADSQPILVEGVTLVYGPALHVTANNLMNQLSVDVTAVGGVSGQTVRVNNWIIRNISLVMNPFIPIVCTSNGTTTWALFANPSVGRPAGEVGFLSGFEEPVLYRKASNSMRISGGLDQAAGDFATMDQHYKGIIGMGGAVLDPKSAVASNGSNS